MGKKRREREKQKKEEDQRLQRERDEREKQRKENEFHEKQLSYRMDKINTLAKTKIGAQIIERLTAEELGTLDTEKILDLQVLELEKEKKELQVRLKKQLWNWKRL